MREESSSRKDSQKKKKVKGRNNFQSRNVLETIVLHLFLRQGHTLPPKTGAFIPAINGSKRCIPASFRDLLSVRFAGPFNRERIFVHWYVLLFFHFNKMWPECIIACVNANQEGSNPEEVNGGT